MAEKTSRLARQARPRRLVLTEGAGSGPRACSRAARVLSPRGSFRSVGAPPPPPQHGHATVPPRAEESEEGLLDATGGAAAAVQSLQGQTRPIYHNDHSRPERPLIRSLDDEIARVIRTRVLNPKWIDGVKRHGYKGAFEIAATVDYMFAFAATTGAVKSHHFDAIEAAFLEDDDTRDFIAEANAPALREIAQRLQEAIDRDLWQPRSNSAQARIAGLL